MPAPRTLRNREIRKLYIALKALDGNKDGVYDLPFKARWNIAKNIGLLERHMVVYERKLNEFMASGKLVEGESLNEDNRERILKYKSLNEQLMDAEEAVEGLLCIKVSDIDKLPVPGSVLSDLMPLIEEK